MANEKRLIDADAVIRKLKNAHCAECNVVRKVQCSACWVNDVLDLLDGDSVDAVKVVRCKDCKRCAVQHNHITLRYQLFCTHGKGYPEVSADDFCSYGERKDNG